MKLQPLVFAAATAASFSAYATTVDWGLHDPLEVAAAVTAVGAFDDSYLFSLLGDNNAFSTAVSNNLTGVLGIADGMVTLYMETGAVDTAVGAFAFNDTTGSISYSFGTLAGGDYYYAVTGVGTGTLGGFYTLSSTVSAVPEMETMALLLGGLGVVGLLVRRRQQ